jgi:glycosyltransferase involved in cell wall biosynthesis
MTQSVKISVISPVYNAADFLPRAVGSVLMQEFDDFEVIIVNDGSTDASASVCDEMAEQDMRVRVIHKENGGVSSARNAGLDAARGEFVMFIDADDAIRDGALEQMYSANSDFVLAGFEKVDGHKILESYCTSKSESYHGTGEICNFFDKVLPPKNTYILNSSCFKLFRRSLLVENGVRFVEGLSFAEDKIFVMSYLQYVERVRTVAFVAYTYFIRSGSLSSDMKSESHARQLFRLLEVYAPVLKRLELRFAGSKRISSLYHMDFVGRYVCRILGIFASRRTELLCEKNIAVLYEYMAADPELGVFSLRFGQIPNILLFKLGSPEFSSRFYSLCSSILRR